mmetsp:Transcript_3355/g.5139  ORF Transcript_3355/g.5139 Transcript_3355/m.5139 type:complete len:81 (-) Transcript_3355:106-348(-)
MCYRRPSDVFSPCVGFFFDMGLVYLFFSLSCLFTVFLLFFLLLSIQLESYSPSISYRQICEELKHSSSKVVFSMRNSVYI